MDINLEYYKIFYYVASYKSITLAAEMLSISQPAVSQAVKHLESNLSCTLFVRTSKGVRLTKEGEMLFSYVQRGYETILSGEKKLSEMLNLEQGEICIGASNMALQVFGIVSTPVGEKPYLKIIPVKEIRDVFVAGRKFEYLKGQTLSYHSLMELPVMCLEGNTSTRQYVECFLAEEGVQLRPEFELATSDMLIQFAVRNLGIASVVEDFAAEYIKSGELFRLAFDRELPKREFCIVSNERIPMSAAASTLLRYLIEHNEQLYRI